MNSCGSKAGRSCLTATSGVLVAAALSLSLTACGDAAQSPEDTSPAEPRTGAVSEPLSFGTIYSIGGSSTTAFTIPNISGSAHTCYLTGIRGSLKAYLAPNSSQFTTASAGVYLEGNAWVIRTEPGYGTGVIADVACVASAARTAISTAGASAAFAPNRTCFLSSISAHGWGWSSFTDLNQSPAAFIDASSGKWTVRQVLTANGNFQPSGGAAGFCIDIPTAAAFLFDAAGGTSHVGGVVQSNASGFMCGAQKIAGVFTGSFNDPNYAARAFVSGADWRDEAGPRMEIGGACIF